MSERKTKYKLFDTNKKILITGVAGFIGFHLAKKLLDQGAYIVGFDNINDYYDIKLKYARLDILNKYSKFKFIKSNLADMKEVSILFTEEKFDIVVNLAAQAGVRYSITNPQVYIESNILGFFNILEACRNNPVEHLLYASSSSVYGNQEKRRF